VAFTARVADAYPLFRDPQVVRSWVPLLRDAASKHACLVLVYCFMPDHFHVMLRGRNGTSDPRKAMVLFKQRSGYWLSRHHPAIHWQKDFFDHVIRQDEDLAAQARYIAGNPVRKGLAACWDQYPHTGAIGIDLGDVLQGLSTS
jgi:REP element-mobilizing transposase RayT